MDEKCPAPFTPEKVDGGECLIRAVLIVACRTVSDRRKTNEN
jgi:hypothetical protein